MSTGKERDKIAAALIEESAEDLYENAPCGYLSTLPNGTIVKINATMLHWLGYEREDLLFERKLQDFFTIGGKIFYETHHAPLLRLKAQVNELNYDLVTKNRQLLPVLLTSHQLRDEAGNALLNRVTIFNITERKKYELELIKARKKAEEASRAKAQFLSTVSHEFRTPMNAIIGIANLLRKTSASQEQLKYIDILKYSSESLLDLINDILDFSRIESGAIQLNEKQFSPQDLVHSVVYALQHKAAEKGLVISLKIDEKLPRHLYGDSVKIGQVLTNLLSNAIKFTEKGKISLALMLLNQSTNSARLLFRVKDSGIGISEDQQDKIFEAFTQASPDINLKYGGSGLGLSICQQLLKMYDSKLIVKSQPGRGAEFSFHLELPVAMSDEQPLQVFTESEAGSIQRIRGMRVLLAEDNPINVMVVAAYLKEWGVTFDVVENGQKALQAVQETNYDVVFMDLHMPLMDGYQATRAIRNIDDERLKQIPVVAFTASAKQDYKERLAEAGITDILSKPFREEALLAVMARYSSSIAEQEPGAAMPEQPHLPAAGGTAGASNDVLSLTQYRKVARHKQETLHNLLQLTIRHFKDYKPSFSLALQARDSKQLGELAHKIKMTLHLLEAHELQAAIDASRHLLRQPNHTEEELQAANLRITQQLDAAIEKLKAAL